MSLLGIQNKNVKTSEYFLCITANVTCDWPHITVSEVAQLIASNWHQLMILQLLAVWLYGNALALVSEVTLCLSRLILGWVTVWKQVQYFGV